MVYKHLNHIAFFFNKNHPPKFQKQILIARIEMSFPRILTLWSLCNPNTNSNNYFRAVNSRTICLITGLSLPRKIKVSGQPWDCVPIDLHTIVKDSSGSNIILEICLSQKQYTRISPLTKGTTITRYQTDTNALDKSNWPDQSSPFCEKPFRKNHMVDNWTINRIDTDEIDSDLNKLHKTVTLILYGENNNSLVLN